MTRGHTMGKEKARGRLRPKARLAAKRRRALALPFDEGGHGGLVGLDDLTGAELLALGESPRVRADVRLGLHRRVHLTGQTLTVGVLQVVGVLQELLGLLAKSWDGLAACKERSCRLAPHCHADAALPPALTAKTTHDLVPLLVELLGWAPYVEGSTTASLGETCDELKSFFEPSTAWWRRCPVGCLVHKERERRREGRG
jgi:hypothetical protein